MAQRHVILIGLPGSGKTTVGRLVATALNTGLVDFDQVLVRKHGMPISQIFGLHGEQAFRQMEKQVAENALSGPPAIMTPGGGWAAQEGNIEAAQAAGAVVVYLKVFPAVAANRASGDGTRPLLVGDDPLARMKKLLDEREPFYKKADQVVPNDSPKTAEQAATEIVQLARTEAGWA